MPNWELKCRVYELAAGHLRNAGSAICNWRFACRDHRSRTHSAFDWRAENGLSRARRIRNTRTKRFTMFSIPELANWSVSALFVETDVVWAGLVTYPEGATRSGGLIRYNLSTRNVRRYDLPDSTLTMFRQNDAFFIGTSNGLYILRNNRLTRFRFEPDLNGKFEPVRDPIP